MPVKAARDYMLEGQEYFLELRLMREMPGEAKECKAFAMTNVGYVPPSLTQAEANSVLRAAKMALFRIAGRPPNPPADGKTDKRKGKGRR
jgi:hypothetical protein